MEGRSHANVPAADRRYSASPGHEFAVYLNAAIETIKTAVSQMMKLQNIARRVIAELIVAGIDLLEYRRRSRVNGDIKG